MIAVTITEPATNTSTRPSMATWSSRGKPAGAARCRTASATRAPRMPSKPAPPARTRLSVSNWRNQPEPAGAERNADRYLTTPAGCAGEEQARDVRAGNEQDEATAPISIEQRLRERRRQPVVQRPEADAHLRIGVRVLALERRRDTRHVRPCRFERDAGRQPRDRAEPVGPAHPPNPRLVDPVRLPVVDLRTGHVKRTSGMTPAISVGMPSRSMRLPATIGSAPKRRRQKPSLITTTRASPARESRRPQRAAD